ncbi:MAG: hypothetical protein AAF551_10390, partial [Bacteroidota bacterium]
MSIFRFDLALFFWITNSLGVVSQPTPELIFPTGIGDVVKLDLSFISYEEKEALPKELLIVFVTNTKREYALENAIQGRYTNEGDQLIFTPYFPFEKGITYVAGIRNADSDAYTFHPFRIGEKESISEARVVNIYPSAVQLPENLLRFYIYFNTPMKK